MHTKKNLACLSYFIFDTYLRTSGLYKIKCLQILSNSIKMFANLISSFTNNSSYIVQFVIKVIKVCLPVLHSGAVKRNWTSQASHNVNSSINWCINGYNTKARVNKKVTSDQRSFAVEKQRRNTIIKGYTDIRKSLSSSDFTWPVDTIELLFRYIASYATVRLYINSSVLSLALVFSLIFVPFLFLPFLTLLNLMILWCKS